MSILEVSEAADGEHGQTTAYRAADGQSSEMTDHQLLYSVKTTAIF